jgi:protein involved in polysaccharide export with SLBB domain
MIGNTFRALLVITAVCFATDRVGEAVAEEAPPAVQYQLGPQDKVSIKVYEWRPARDEVYEWTAFKAEYTVNAAGSLSLPLLGEVPVKGLSTSALADDLGQRLQHRMGLLDSPDVTVEVVQYRPFYIMGSVEKPGEYPYRPGLTVLEAFAIAGGRPRAGLGVRLTRESIATRGELDALDLETQTLHVRLARLKAELDNLDAIAWPDDIESQMAGGPVSSAVRQEQLVFDTRREAYQTQLGALRQLETFLANEVESLQKQLKVHEIEVESVKSEFEMVKKLYKKGLTAAPRKLALQRNMAQVDGERLRLEASLMRARQEISKTKIAIADLQAKRSSEVSSEMQKAHARLDELKGRTRTSKNLLYETEVLAPQMIAAQQSKESVQPIFKIVRQGRALSDERAVSQETVVQPGDTIRVEQPMQESSVGPSRQPTAASVPTASVSVYDTLR